MDAATLADAVTELLAPALPYILKLAGKGAEEAAGELGKESAKRAVSAWKRLRPKAGQEDPLAKAARALAVEPESGRRRAALSVQIEERVQADAALFQALAAVIAAGRAQVSVTQKGSGVAQHGSHPVGAGAGGVGVGHDVHGDVIVINAGAEALTAAAVGRLLGRARPPKNLQAATEKYLAHLVGRYRYLDFKGMGVSDRVPLKLPLLEMYVPLRARVELPPGETWDREALRIAGRRMSQVEVEAVGRRLSEPRPVLDLLRASGGLVVLGDPGAGKTTFLKFLAVSLATGQHGALNLDARLPVLLPISAYANALSAGETPLVEFIARFYEERGVELPLGAMVDAALEQGRALVLLDGLDEVRDLGLRHTVVDRVTEFFTYHRPAGNQFVVTSRIVGYREVRPIAEGLAECTLIDFDDDEIAAFVGKWTAAIERAAAGDTALAAGEAAREREELLDATRRNPGVRTLATNPLLLTILALMKRQGVTLPERRVELYQKYVETLLRHWNLARGLDRRPTRDLDVVETVRILAPLALWMHCTSPGVGLVKEGELGRELEKIFHDRGVEEPARAAVRFLEDVRDYASLLLDRGGRQFGFIHLTFQEYLAAVAIAHQGQQSIEPIVDALGAHVGDPGWREVSLLTVGYLGIVQQRDEAAGAVLHELIRRAPGDPGEAIVLAGEAVADVWPGGVTPAGRAEVRDALLAAMTDTEGVAAPVRAKAGRALAEVGDPRRPVLELDEMEFCLVPAGPFRMGSDAKDKDARDNERKLHLVEMPDDFWIARYPLTVSQFRQVVAAGGVAPGDRDSLRGAATEPVVWVSQREAQAVCAWLTERWRERGWISHDWAVRLPSEAEWEKAARGGIEVPRRPRRLPISALRTAAKAEPVGKSAEERRIYPWGSDADVNRMNCGGTKVGRSSPVGSFPGGTSPYGCEDLAGNVWEWTRSRYERYPYPRPGPKRGAYESENVADDASVVLRGGSFIFNPRYARCACRDGFNPDYRFNYIGFRVLVSPFFSGL